MRKTKQFSALHVLILVLSPLARADACQIDSAGTRQLVSFLRDARFDSAVTGDCKIAAIRELEPARSNEGINLLVEYLDYQRPGGETEVVTGSNSDSYPAVNELFSIGKPALTALVRAVAGNDASKQAGDNALKTIMLIYRDDPPAGIKFLLNRSANSNDDQGAWQLPSDRVRWCYDKYRDQCESVLNSQ